MAIKHLILHSVLREKKGDPLNLNLRDHENPLADPSQKPDETTNKFADSLIELFASSTLNVGEFADKGDTDLEPAFEQKLKKYYSTNTDCSDFVELTQELAKLYKRILETKKLSSVPGGILAFYQYTSGKNDWLAVAILLKTEGFDSSTDLDVRATEIIDLSKLHLAATVNLTQWKTNLHHRYIKFKSGARSEIRDYFEEFVGCQRDKHAATIETKSLKEAIRKFSADAYQYSNDEISEKVGQAHDFIKDQQSKHRPIYLQELANHIFPDRADEFAKTARSDHNLSEELVIDNGTLRGYKKISARGNGLSITFDREMVGKAVNLTDDGGLIINQEMVSESLRKQIQEELDERQAKDKP